MEPSHLFAEQLQQQAPAANAFAEAAAIMARLRAPNGCPWDLEQTLDSIKPHTLEEVYEVFDAIDRRDFAGLRDELGDLLLQVLFYAQIAQDEGHFNMTDVANGLAAKLLRRHPHVFGEAVANNASDVTSTWEAVKQQERAGKPQPPGLLEKISRAMPAFTEARKLGKAAASVGFDWPETQGLFDKVDEEIRELKAELRTENAPDPARVEEEFGDLLFVLTNLARHVHVDPEQALRRANAKFRSRFGRMETFADATPLKSHSADELEALWTRAKQEERS